MSKNIKIAVLTIVTLAASLIAWHSLGFILSQNSNNAGIGLPQFVATVIYPVLAFCFLLAMVGICAVLIEQELVRMGIWLAVSMALLLFFPFSVWLLIVSLIQALNLLFFSLRVKNEASARIYFSLFKSIKWGLGLAVTGLIFSVTIIYYLDTAREQKISGKTPLDAVVESSVNYANKIMPARLKGYDPNMTLDQFLLQTGASTLEHLANKASDEVNNALDGQSPVAEEKKEPMFLQAVREKIKNGDIAEEQIPPELVTKINDGSVALAELAVQPVVLQAFSAEIDKLREQFLKNVGIEADGNETMSQVLRKIIRLYAFQFFGSFQKFLYPLLALSLFFALLLFNALFQALTRLMAYLIYELFRKIKFIKIKDKMQNIRYITID